MTEIDILIRLGVALLCGGAIGLEREFFKHPAGLRTFALVSVASALAMILQLYLCEQTALVDGMKADSGRIPGQVLTGIGFIGAGLIMKNNDSVQGLTTAACIFMSAVLGLVCGAGMLLIASVTTAGTIVILVSSQLWRKYRSNKQR